MRNRAVMCLGGNAPETEALIGETFQFLASKGSIGLWSGTYRTEAENGGHGTYVNAVLQLDTDADFDVFRAECKEYERKKRLHAAAGLVNIDIDIVIWNGDVLRPAEAASAYFRRGFAAISV